MYQSPPPGSRPLHKILEGDAARFLPVAQKKLAELQRSPAPFLSQTLTVDDATITVDKLGSVDRITIVAGLGPWISVSFVSLFDNLQQFAFGTPSKWAEPPKNVDDTLPPFANTAGIFSGVIATRLIAYLMNPSSYGPVYALGDGRWCFSIDSGAQTASMIVFDKTHKLLFSKLICNNNIINGDGYGEITTQHGDESGTAVELVATAYDNMRFAFYTMWAPNPFLGDQITAQFAVFSLKGHYRSPDLVFPRINYYAFDVDHGTAPTDHGHAGASGGFTGVPHSYRQIVDADVGDASAALFSDVADRAAYVLPSAVFLTPARILVSCAFETTDDRFDPGSGTSRPEITDRQYVGVSTDYGRTWEQFVELGDSLLGTRGDCTWAALNSTAALKSSLIVTSATYVDSTRTDAVEWQIRRVGIDRSSELLKVVTDTDSDLAVEGEVVRSKINAMGRGVYLAQFLILYLIDNGHGGFNKTFRSKFMTSFDYGVTWTDLVDSGFDAASSDAYLGRDGTFNGERLVAGEMYPRTPYAGEADQGLVYLPVARWKEGVGLGFTHSAVGTDLYVSRDLCRTWAVVSTMSHKLPSLALDQIRFNYNIVIDTSAPIDPIFPWTRDARIAPPDWW